MLDFWYSIDELPIAMNIGASWWFPLLESIHVLAAVFVLGSIVMVDLRLLGWAARTYSIRNLLNDFLPWTWVGFAIALITGIFLFITNASGYAYNLAFQIKLALLLVAGINMLLFHRFSPKIPQAPRAIMPLGAKLFGGLSLFIWVGVMFAGRWVGHLA